MPKYEATEGCYISSKMKRSAFSHCTKTITHNGQTRTEDFLLPTSVSTSTYTTTFTSDDAEDPTAISWLPMVILVHKQSDVTSNSAGSASSSADLTSNAAAKLGTKTSTWDELGTVKGVSAAAVALGAAIALHW
ncbi:hypothetical protein N7462_011187 [Penicillium macrosclerotiorum]|uniref:uncharacterized protein n=1 Tax=Penicillium macrosclerotiorum TaxID=303699 RepID=UPI002547F727|nr:uncharacterized protein N7462_011187 [Penicillium macrosclerotiorum]KAJ5666778.1 hypothetical protein N7462_011187 [Penicillium macrosclerotiorum]